MERPFGRLDERNGFWVEFLEGVVELNAITTVLAGCSKFVLAVKIEIFGMVEIILVKSFFLSVFGSTTNNLSENKENIKIRCLIK